ncbi:MAG: hypothetical protein M1840_004230 [Geoglossum simile]|nr:MAG: hypothetical protein M1840_004230 [Geoglossum simile]
MGDIEGADDEFFAQYLNYSDLDINEPEACHKYTEKSSSELAHQSVASDGCGAYGSSLPELYPLPSEFDEAFKLMVQHNSEYDRQTTTALDSPQNAHAVPTTSYVTQPPPISSQPRKSTNEIPEFIPGVLDWNGHAPKSTHFGLTNDHWTLDVLPPNANLIVSHGSTIECINPPMFPVPLAGEQTLQLPQPPLKPQVLQGKPKQDRCWECRFANAGKCTGGFPCERCKRIFNRLNKNLQQETSMDYVLMFDLLETQKLCVALRDETDRITGLYPGNCLEDGFKKIICSVDNIAIPNLLSLSRNVIAIKELATTRRAAQATQCSGDLLVCPALDGVQIDRFVDTQICTIPSKCLPPIEKHVILTALRLSAYIAILFNWDKNTIYTTDTGLLQSKNLVLETLYAIAYRVQHLIEEHFRAVQTSLSSTNTTSDPATISCALWIVYRVLNGANKLHWKAKSLQNLGKFLNGLLDRIPAALNILERYKAKAAHMNCSPQNAHTNAFDMLIKAQTPIKAVVSFAYERHRDYFISWTNDPYHCPGRSYTDILEAKATLMSDDQDLTGTTIDFAKYKERAPELKPQTNNTPRSLYGVGLETALVHGTNTTRSGIESTPGLTADKTATFSGTEQLAPRVGFWVNQGPSENKRRRIGKEMVRIALSDF